METILFLAHTESDGSLPRAALEALGAAKALASDLPGTRLAVGLIGAGVQPAAKRIAGCGAEKLLAVTGDEFAPARYASDTVAVEALCRAAGASLIVAAGTSRLSRVMAGVAQRLAGRIDTHATEMSVKEGVISVSRWYYRQRMEAGIQRTQRPWVVLVDPGCHAPWEGPSAEAVLQLVSPNLPEECRRTTLQTHSSSTMPGCSTHLHSKARAGLS